MINVCINIMLRMKSYSIGGQRMALACRELRQASENRDKER